MNEQDKIQGKQFIEVDNLSEKEFKIMVVKISEKKNGGRDWEDARNV